jgi:L-ascorbate metabolism protein UlaG (beta-lactamase superfamily)
MKRSLNILKRPMLIILAVVLLLFVAACAVMHQPQFGELPKGTRLARIEKSPHFKDGRFHNRVETPTISEGYSFTGELYKTLFKNYPRRAPKDSLPSVKTNLKGLPPGKDLIVWFGHSSVYIQAGGIRFLIDPSFSGKASPLPWGPKAFKGSNIYATSEIPEIDYLLISHDHYDHLDHETVLALKHKIRYVVCGLGTGAHFERWGFTPEQIIEKDWYEKIAVNDSVIINTESSHHDSGRGFTRGKALWMSYLIQTPKTKIYISGDGGFDDHFAAIGEKYGTIDWAVMEDGQYDKAWNSVHNLPEEVVQATLDLKAANLLPVHHSKFILGKHPWDEPLIKITELSSLKPYRLATPMIGEVVWLNDSSQVFKQWWKGIN